MIFELISWIYISLICFIWASQILKLFLSTDKVAMIDFPVVCLIGMAIIGVISFYVSLVIQLNILIKLSLQIPALFILFKSDNCRKLVAQFKKSFFGFSMSDYIFLSVILVMILFLSTSLIIHPDTINYHVFSTQIFDKYGTITGLANLKPEFGFQSIWFSALAFFDFPPYGTSPLFLLNGCAMCWVIILLISMGTGKKRNATESTSMISRIWCLILILFCILSWTQIRLTSSSLSPDFIAAIFILLSFYFFSGRKRMQKVEDSDLLAILFSIFAITVKLSSVAIILIPFFIIVNGIIRKRWVVICRIILTTVILFAPIIIRSILISGYPFYPSSFGAFYSYDWKVGMSEVLRFQNYITAYARYPVSRINAVLEYKQAIISWLPVWWRHLYLIDKTVVLIIASGVLVDLSFFRIWIQSYSRRTFAALFVAITGVVFWFVNAPDPRFGTGFLLPLIYFQYDPFIKKIKWPDNGTVKILLDRIKYISIFFVIVYAGYRLVYFFKPQQLVFPVGIEYTKLILPGCDGKIKKMLIDNAETIPQLPDSCRQFIFRGTTIRQGFKPAL